MLAAVVVAAAAEAVVYCVPCSITQNPTVAVRHASLGPLRRGVGADGGQFPVRPQAAGDQGPGPGGRPSARQGQDFRHTVVHSSRCGGRLSTVRPPGLGVNVCAN